MNTKYIHIGKSTILWEKTSFSRAFKFLKNNSLSRAELSDDNGNVKNIHYGDILIKFSECLYADEGNSIPYIINDNIAYKLLKLSPLINGDIVFADAAEDNTVGKCIEIITHNDTDLVAGLHTIPCRPTIKFAEGYLGYYLNSSAFHNQLLQYIQGTKISSISKKSICQTIISYPSEIINQQKIASYFQSLDSLIQSTSKKLVSLKQVKAASLQSMFPQEGETVPKVRFKGFEGKWDKVKLSTLGQTYSGLTSKTKEDFNCGDSLYIPFLNVLLNPQIDESNLQKVRIENNEKQNEIHKGDILFNTSSETPEEVGLCSVFMSDIKKVYLNSFCFGFRLFNNLVDPLYIVYLLRSQIGRKLMLILAQGATRYNLSKKSFLNAHIIIPTSQQEQQKIASYFRNLDKQISLQTQRLEKLKQIKAACLDKMFV